MQGQLTGRGTVHYSDAIMSAMASQITCVSIICLIICSGADQRKYQSSASMAFGRGMHQWLVDFPHKGIVTRKMFPFDDVIMHTIASVPVNNRCWYIPSIYLRSIILQPHQNKDSDKPCMDSMVCRIVNFQLTFRTNLELHTGLCI